MPLQESANLFSLGLAYDFCDDTYMAAPLDVLREHPDACPGTGAHAPPASVLWTATLDFAKRIPRDGARGHIRDALAAGDTDWDGYPVLRAHQTCVALFDAAAETAHGYGDLVSSPTAAPPSVSPSTTPASPVSALTPPPTPPAPPPGLPHRVKAAAPGPAGSS